MATSSARARCALRDVQCLAARGGAGVEHTHPGFAHRAAARRVARRASCTDTAPVSKPGKVCTATGRSSTTASAIPVDRVAPRGRARARSAGNPRRTVCAGSTRSTIGGCWLFAVENFRGALAPRGGEAVDQPARVRVPLREILVGSREQRRALRDEPSQHSVDDATRATFTEHAARIHGQVHLRLGGAARVLDLVRGGDQQRRQPRRQFVERSADAAARAPGWSRRYQRKVPSAIARTAARSMRSCDGFERRVGRAAFIDDVVHGERRGGQRFGAGRVATAARLRRRISPDCCLFHVPNLMPARRTALAKSRAETGRLPARCSSRTASTPSPQATRKPSSADT